LFNYIDPEITRNYLSRNLGGLHPRLARILARLIDSNQWEGILNKEVPLKKLRVNRSIKAKLREAIALNERMALLTNKPQNINLNLTNLKGDYIYKKYIVDKTCCLDCAFVPREEKEIKAVTSYKETLALEPYSVVLIVIDESDQAAAVESEQPVEQPVEQPIEQHPEIEPEEPMEKEADQAQEKGVEQDDVGGH
jgi:hypothetical protein